MSHCLELACPHCQTINRVPAALFERLRFLKLDTEAHQQAAAQHQIRSIPTLALFRQGREVARVSGALPGPQLRAWLAQHGL
ncbi:MAG: thioredoxin family protein [Aquabacterium sp.]|jgi:thioredoxin 2